MRLRPFVLCPAHFKDEVLALAPEQPGGTAQPLATQKSSQKKGLKQALAEDALLGRRG